MPLFRRKLYGARVARPLQARAWFTATYFPEDVMVAGDGCVCGVIDFGALTPIGDADRDLAGQPAVDLQNR
jgi:hypothetical protein